MAACRRLPFLYLRRASIVQTSRSDRMKIVPLLVTLMIYCVQSHGQSLREVSRPAPTEKTVPARSLPTSFAIDGKDSGSLPAVAFRTADQMSALDRELAANPGSAIAELAKYAGLEFNQGKWSYEQVVCTALPEHLFLRFTRNNGTGDVS